MIIFNEARNGSFVIPLSDPITKLWDVIHIPVKRKRDYMIIVGHSIKP